MRYKVKRYVVAQVTKPWMIITWLCMRPSANWLARLSRISRMCALNLSKYKIGKLQWYKSFLKSISTHSLKLGDGDQQQNGFLLLLIFSFPTSTVTYLFYVYTAVYSSNYSTAQIYVWQTSSLVQQSLFPTTNVCTISD